MAKVPGVPRDRQRKRDRQRAPEGVTLPIRVLLRGCDVVAERTSPDNDAVDLVLINVASGTEYVLEMDSEQNVQLAQLLLKGKPASALATMAQELVGIEIVGPDAIPEVA
jgi:hypothetical protein